MYQKNFDMGFEGDHVYDDLLFEFSPAESLINFELPSSFAAVASDWQISDHLNLSSDTFANGASERNDDFNLTECSNLFDFADLDRSVDFDSYLLDNFTDTADVAPQYGSDSADSDDALGRLSVLGIDLDSTSAEEVPEDATPGHWSAPAPSRLALEPNQPKVEAIKCWGEPTFCTEYSAFRCPVEECGKLYAKASHVRAHLRRHSGDKPYRCTWGECAWRFARSDELARHRRSHSGDKPYRCRECDKRFARSDHLAKHGRVHARRAAAAAAARRAAAAAAPLLPRVRRLYVQAVQ